jgi:DNA helicase-2/ATP-dependent DNA helicase PcrA
MRDYLPQDGSGSRPVLLPDADALCRVLDVPFSAQQLAAVTAPLGPAAVVAGAGSGKTTVMAARVVWLVGRGLVRPEQVLGLTFTNKAAAELASRVRDALARLSRQAGTDLLSDGEPTVSTYHAFAGQLVAEHGLRLGIEPDLRLVADASRFQRAARVVGSHRASVASLSTHLPTVIGDVIALDGQLSDHLVQTGDVRAMHARLRKELASIPANRRTRLALEAAGKRDDLLDLVDRYREVKATDGVCDFADTMASGARLAVECSAVGVAMRERYAVTLLDEYQDTSVAQRRMLQGLFSGATADSGRGHPVTAVGDPCQAIYGWRGASVDNLDAFPDHFPLLDGGPAPVLTLSVNRRCGSDVLSAANTLAGRLYDQHQGVEPLEASPTAGRGAVSVALLADVAAEVELVADRVLEARGEAEVLAPHRSPARWSDIAILVRTGAEVAALAASLRRRGVPVEVVGLSGLLSQPEVADVVATVEVVHSLTANAALLRLLTGPRWRIGARDLALLGRRARGLSGSSDVAGEGLEGRLEAAVTGVDPTEVLSLCDALDDPGDEPYSEQARMRFAALSRELTQLRRSVGEPLTDLVRRVVDTIGLDVELASMPAPESVQARDNLALLLDAVGDFSSSDPYASLHGLLAYLRAEEDFNAGMAVAAPTDSDSVKLLTVHKAKGLEWRVVMVPFLSAKVFPSARGRERWTSCARELPTELRGDAGNLPVLSGWGPADEKAFHEESKRSAELEELRLAYVAVTRAKDLAVLSGHWWGRTQLHPRGPSRYLVQMRNWLECSGGQVGEWAADPATDEKAPRDDEGKLLNPLVLARARAPWPAPLDEHLLHRRREAAALVESFRSAGDATTSPAADSRFAEESLPESLLEAEELDRLGALDADTEQLLAEAQRDHADVVAVDLPASLTATSLMRLHTDPDGLARSLARPMPRRPSPTARLGTRFHAWLESRTGQQSLLGPDELPGRSDDDIRDEADLAALIAAFEAGPYAGRRPFAVEAPFALVLAGRVVRGRIDAVYQGDDESWEVVDWKTGHGGVGSADPLQLAVYRLAWAEAHDLPPETVGAAFVHVRTGEVERPRLADRAVLEGLLLEPVDGPVETGERA